MKSLVVLVLLLCSLPSVAFAGTNPAPIKDIIVNDIPYYSEGLQYCGENKICWLSKRKDPWGFSGTHIDEFYSDRLGAIAGDALTLYGRDFCSHIKFAPDGLHFICNSHSNTNPVLGTYKPRTNPQVKEIPSEFADDDSFFTPQGSRVISNANETSVTDTRSGVKIKSVPFNLLLALDESKMIVELCNSGACDFWIYDIDSDKLIRKLWDSNDYDRNGRSDSSRLKLSPNGKYLAEWFIRPDRDYNAFLRVSDINTGKHIFESVLKFQPWDMSRRQHKIRFSADSSKVIIESIIKNLNESINHSSYLFDVKNGGLIFSTLTDLNQNLNEMTFSADGKNFILLHNNGLLKIGNASTGKVLREWMLDFKSPRATIETQDKKNLIIMFDKKVVAVPFEAL